MATEIRTRIALSNTSRFTVRAFADARAIEQKYWVDVLMGENGIFLVPSTRREQSILVALGYEVAPK